MVRLVEDDPPPRSGIEDWIWEAPVAAADEFVAAKPYMKPIFSWRDPGREAGAQGEAQDSNHRGSPPSSITAAAHPDTARSSASRRWRDL